MVDMDSCPHPRMEFHMHGLSFIYQKHHPEGLEERSREGLASRKHPHRHLCCRWESMTNDT